MVGALELEKAVFEEIVGAEFVRESEGLLRVLPADAEQTATVMRACAERGLVVSATGAGTKMGWGRTVAARVLLDVSRMRGVVEHSWGDLVATVGAGTTWAEMQRVLAEHGQRVALDPLFAERATVGGVLATNDSGLLRMRYGSLRDWVLGMTVVLADGTVARTGGKVVKNVAGYDIPKLMTGSFGTLGVMTEATFRLHPVAKDRLSFTVRAGEVAGLADLMTAVLRAGLSVERMQMRTEAAAFAVDVELASLPEVLVEHEGALRRLASPLLVDGADEDIFGAREGLFREAGGTVLKVTAQTTKLAAIVAGMSQLAQIPEHTARCVADPVGIVTARLTGPEESLAEIVEDLRARLAGSGGAVVVLEGGMLPLGFDVWGPVPAAIDVMRAIKVEFDPGRVLNPGKFVGGI